MRGLLIAALAFGTIAGFGSGFAHLRHHHCAREQHAQWAPPPAPCAPAPSAPSP